MNNPFIILIALPFMVMLFWKKQSINTFIFLHTVIVGIVVAGAWETHNVLGEYELIIELQDYLSLRFGNMYDLVFDFSLSLLIIWNYQWWFIGKEKERLFSHNI